MNATQELKEERKHQMIGYSITFVVHGLIFLWLWFSVLHTPDPPLGYGGMELSMAFGEADMGGPSDIPVDEPVAVKPTPQEPQPEEQIVTNEADEEVKVTAKPPVEKPKTPVEVKKPTEKPKPVEQPVEKPRVADQRSLFKKSNTQSGESGRGDGEVPGNQGNPNGVPDGDPNGDGIGNGRGGSGGGTGIGDGPGGDGVGSFDLKGRTLSRRPDVTENSRETGKVVVGITVDRTGKVIKVQPGLKGTTTLNPALIEKAKQGAMDARFSPKPDGPEEQYGTMTFVFRFKQ